VSLSDDRYNHSAKGVARDKRFAASGKGRARYRRYYRRLQEHFNYHGDAQAMLPGLKFIEAFMEVAR